MKRYHQDRLLIRQRSLWYARNSHHFEGEAIKYEINGHFRKRKPFDCGKTRCYLCSQDKLLNRPTKRDLINNDIAKDSLADWVN